MEWIKNKLGNLIQVKYGKDHKKLEDGKYPCYGSGGLMRFVESQIYDGPSILIPRKGTLNNIMYSESPFWTVDTMFWSIIDQDKIDPKYLFYHICKKDFAGMNVGSAVPSMTVPILNDIAILYPTKIEDQKRIADILSSLDAKIENNNKINAKLEEMAQALFKSWFIDFEPFKDGTFVESELGMIPEGWKVVQFASVFNFQEGPGIRNWQYVSENGTKFINIRCIKGNDLDLTTANMISHEEAEGKYKPSMLKEWDIVMSTSGTLGRYAIIRKEHLPLCLNTSVIRFYPKEEYAYSYMYSYLSSSIFKELLETMACGSVQANFGPTHLKQIALLYPSEDIIRNYNNILRPIIEKIVLIMKENNNLAQTRDTLLPKLMSGEIEL